MDGNLTRRWRREQRVHYVESGFAFQTGTCRRNGLSSWYYRPPAALRLVAFGALTTAIGFLPLDAASGPDIPLPGAAAPALARLFTPPHVPEGTYQVAVLDEGIVAALRRVREALPPGVRTGNPPGAWRAESLDPLDAFGRAGTYDRAKLAQLYWGRHVTVVRGPIERDGRVVGALTLVSPHPDPTLTRLEPGTLAILLRTGG